MTMLRRLFGTRAPDVQALEAGDDIQGLVRALRCADPDIVGAAATAIARLHASGDAAMRAAAEAAAPELICAFSGVGADTPSGRYARISVLESLGELGSSQAARFLLGVVADTTFQADLRAAAAASLGHIPGAGHADALGRALNDERSREVRSGAARGLLQLGTEGLQLLRTALLEGDELSSGCAKEALEREVAARGRHHEPAAAILEESRKLARENELDAARATATSERRETAERAAREEEERWQAAEREKWEQAVVRKRLEAFPAAARLATALGHPEWVAGARLLKPATEAEYAEAVSGCRARGLPTEQHENVLEVRRLRGIDENGQEDLTEETRYEASATVEFEGERFDIAGFVGTRRVLS